MLNERIEDLMYQAGLTAQGCWDKFDDYARFSIEKFAELIVKECIDTVLNSDDNIYMDREGWNTGGPDHSAWTRGVLDSVEIIREHFGIKE